MTTKLDLENLYEMTTNLDL